MATTNITIKIEGKHAQLEVRPFVNIINNTISILQSLEREISESRESKTVWRIEKVKMESPLQITFRGESDTEEETVDTITPFMGGMREIETKGTRPKYFNIRALDIAKQMLHYTQNGGVYITFDAPEQKQVKPTEKSVANLILLTAPKVKPYWIFTQIEGRLDDIAAHSEQPRFVIYDPLTDAKIRCEFNKDEVKDIRNLVTERVRVSGETKFDECHRPVEVKVKSYQKLREQSELPQIEDLHKANINITNGMDSVAFIEELRGEGEV